MDEFDLIEQCFKPLAHGFPGSLNLTDDAAVFSVPNGFELVATTDAMSEGVHFIGNEDPSLIARKLLRTNLSDLAAMGAKPMCYLIAGMLPKATKADWVKRFCEGLARDQKEFGVHVAGGDTIATLGPLCLSLTALGTVPTGKAIKRSTAKAGDTIFVSGTLGDSALGLASLRGQFKKLGKDDAEYLEQRYLLPQPRLWLGHQLLTVASSCMDISDGLVQDLGHICKASGVGAEIESKKIPVSEAASHAIALSPEHGISVLTGGDDYELLFTVPKEKLVAVPKDCTAIGVIKAGKEVTVLDDKGKPMTLAHKGYSHF